MLRYMPYGLVMGIPVAGILLAVANLLRSRKKREAAAVLPMIFRSEEHTSELQSPS